MKIKTKEDAIKTIIESSEKHAEATDTGDYKTCNKNYTFIKKSVDYLMENGEIDSLRELLNCDSVSVKLWVASFLIRLNEEKAIQVVESIASQSIRHHSFGAQVLLEEWKKGNLKSDWKH